MVDQENKEESPDSEEEETTESHPDNSSKLTEPENESSEDEIEDEEELDEEEDDFDLEAQIEVFLEQIEEDPENCLNYYNLGEAYMDLGDMQSAKSQFELALQYDLDQEFGSIIHFALGELLFSELMSGIQSKVILSSVGLHSAHKAGASIVDVNDEDYKIPIREFEQALDLVGKLKADEEIVDYVSQNAPLQIADLRYKWASDLIDKSRQIDLYGDEIKDVKQAQKLLKKTVAINPNHSQANLMIKYTKKMIQEGWESYDEYGFIAKKVEGQG